MKTRTTASEDGTQVAGDAVSTQFQDQGQTFWTKRREAPVSVQRVRQACLRRD